jgi:hypothetical protein
MTTEEAANLLGTHLANYCYELRKAGNALYAGAVAGECNAALQVLRDAMKAKQPAIGSADD